MCGVCACVNRQKHVSHGETVRVGRSAKGGDKPRESYILFKGVVRNFRYRFQHVAVIATEAEYSAQRKLLAFSINNRWPRLKDILMCLILKTMMRN